MSYYPARGPGPSYLEPPPTLRRRQRQRQQHRSAYRDFANPGELIADEQPLLPTNTQQQELHQQNQFPSWHAGTPAFPGYHFDPFKADPTLATPNDINVLVRAFTAIPRFLYFSVLLFLPFFYHTRVHQIFNGVHLTENEIASHYGGSPLAGSWRPKHWGEVKLSWSDFIDSTLKEWSTLNIVSVLLLSAIYNLLQLGGSGSHLIQCTALMSLISALTSLIFGCLYVIRFETMRRPHKAMQWAQNALHSSSNTWWNVFVLLSLPFVWLAWSIVLFIICLISVIWQTSAQPTNAHSLTPLSFDVKIITSAFLFIGFLHLCLILITFSQYGDIDEAWSERFKHITQGAAPSIVYVPGSLLPTGHHDRYMLPYEAPTLATPMPQPPVQVVVYTPSTSTEETSMDSETRRFPARHRQERRGPHRGGRHRYHYSEDADEESEPHPSASRHRDEPTQARYYRSEDSSEDMPQIPSPKGWRIQSRRRRRRRRRSRGSVESTYRPSHPVVRFAPTPSPRTAYQIPAPSESPVTRQHNQTQRQMELVRDTPVHAHNTSLYNRDQNDAESRQSAAPRSRRDTSVNLSLSGVSTPQPEHSQNRGE